ncbi:hypothetical protein ABEF95_006521 [Exophiala dermatitidis]
MPPFPGEETLITVYADVHVYFDAPTRRPFLHRFDKASYFYIYYNSTRQTSRIEVALHPGTSDQAAFNGYLDNVKVINSHTFPTKVTLVVDGLVSSPLGTAASPSSAQAHPKRDPDEWRLPSADPRDPGINKYRVHTVDFYFWVQEDAKLVVDIFKRLVQTQQLEIDEELEPEPHDADTQKTHYDDQSTHHDMVSPVVQNLEHVAISDPVYHKDSNHRDLHDPSSSSPTNPRPEAAHAHVQAQSPSPTLSVPQTQPTAHAQVTSGPSTSPGTGTSIANAHSNVQQRAPSVTKAAQAQPQPQPASSTTNFTPLAYNPAAPAAPEPIAHREDTPPPVDGMDGTGLAAAAKHDGIGMAGIPIAAAAGGYPQTYQSQTHAHAPYPPHIGTHPQGAALSPGPPPPQANPTLYNQYGAPSPQPPSFGPHASAAASSPQPPANAPSFGPQAAAPAAAGMTSSPAASFSSSSHQHQQQQQQQYPPTSPRTSVASSSHHHYGVPSQDPNAHIFGASQQQSSSPVQTPGTQFYNSLDGGQAQGHKPLQHIQPQYPDYLAAGGHTQPPGHHGAQPPPPPVGGYSNYHYSGQSPPHSNTNPYDIHHQVYRPTEQEHHTHHHSKPSRSSSSKPSQAERIEKGVGKLFKRIEKKIG